MENVDIARVFAEVADLLEIQGANPFRIRAYRNATRTLEELPTPAAELLQSGLDSLAQLPGIGKDLAGKIKEIVETGELGLMKALTREWPRGLVTLMHIPGLGPKRTKLVYQTLGISTLDELERAARAGKLRALPGLGQTLEQRILQGVGQEKAHLARHRLAEAEAHVGPLLAHLSAVAGLRRIDVAGSFRRRSETVGDIDILVVAARPQAVADAFVRHGDVRDVLAHGRTRCSVVLRSGLQVDLRLVPDRSYGAALHYFTGSKAHNIAVRMAGVKRDLKINEYGVFRGTRAIGGRTEAEVYDAVGLPWIPPELREARGELEAAAAGTLPALVEADDIRGDLQMHTTYSDGKATLAEMASACRERGYEYLAVTDHTKAVRVAGGLDREGFRRQFREIDKLRGRLRGITLLKSAEVDILADGTLDLDADTLAEMDVVVVSVHSGFTMPREAMTRRVVRALRQPGVHILGHPTGRLLGRREPYAIDIEEVVRVAREEGVLLEINAQPDRLDLSDVHARLARDAGVKLVISTDAHRVEELDFMRHGIDQARRGWCTAADVANTRPLSKFRKLLRA